MALADLKKAELVALCEGHGLDTSGTKADLVARLEEAGVGDDATPDEGAAEIIAPTLELDEAPVEVSMDGFDMDAGETDEFLKGLYLHVLGREIDAGGLAHYTRVLDFYGTQTRADVLNDLLESAEYKKNQG